MDVDRDALLARIDALQLERRRAFDEAQREADALFAQYQLSQLLASGGTLDSLASSVVLELVRLAGGAGGALWLGGSKTGGLDVVAQTGAAPASVPKARAEAADPTQGGPPTRLASVDDGRAWVAAHPGTRAIVLSDTQPETLLAVWPVAGDALDEDGLRIVQLARHELAVAFTGARLHETLEHERRELGAIVDGATDLILQVDADGRVVRLNPAGERLLGVRAGSAAGRTCSDVLGCEVVGGHGIGSCPLAEVRASGTPITYRETVITGAGGAPLRVAGSYASTATAAEGPRATAIVRDISAVQALEELREGFVATVSHELRTPLALIRGYAETLLHLELDPAQQRAYIERIDEASGRLTALVDQVLDVTHLQADPLILERAPTSFASLVARLRGDLAVSGGVDRLLDRAAADLPPVDVDVRRVGQILANIVGNALKYAPDDSPVELGAAVDGRWLVVTIDDEGVGIPAADLDLVTEPFHRAWNVRESRIPGTGLGLYISRRLVEAHGGALWLGDRPDGRPGTRVGFTLPLAHTRRRSASAGSPPTTTTAVRRA